MTHNHIMPTHTDATVTPRFCKDCGYFKQRPDERFAYCLAVPSQDLVHGMPERCSTTRNGVCGVEAKLFIPAATEKIVAAPADNITGDSINDRYIFVICKAAHEDLLDAINTFGKQSPEYKRQLERSMIYISRSIPRILEIAINNLERHGHDKLPRTTRTD